MQQENQLFYEFGHFQLDVQKHRLLRDGEIVQLTPKAVEVLLLLVQHQGKLVERDELMNAVWHDSFVEDSNLTVTISMLRKVLEHDGEGKYIETIPRLGYRFVAGVREISGNDTVIALEKRTQAQIVIEEIEQDDSKQDSIVPAIKKLRLPQTKWLTKRNVIVAVVSFCAIAAVAIALRYSNRNKSNAPSIKSIAVLPLRYFGVETDDQDLHLRITDALITKFGNLRSVAVRPTSSVLRYSDNKRDAIAIGKELNVDAVIDGSVQREGTRLRVMLQLINVGDSTEIWSGQFDGQSDQLLVLQDKISTQVLQNLPHSFSDPEREGFAKHATKNSEAFDAYLKGRFFWNQRTEEGFKKAVVFSNQAVKTDPNYAQAYSGLADCYILLGIWGAMPPNEAMPKAKEAVMQALKTDDTLAEAHTSLAFIKWVYDWDWARADEEFQKALQLNPNYPTAHHWRSYYLAATGRFDEAVSHIKKSQELEGSLSFSISTDIGEIYCWARQYDKAVEKLQEVVRIEPNFASARNALGIAYLKKGQINEAIAELEAARRLENSPRMMSSLGYAYGISGQKDKARLIINELKELSRHRYVSAFAIAVVHAGLGEDEEALARLEDAYNERSDTMAILGVYPLLDSLRANPRFAKLQQRAGHILR